MRVVRLLPLAVSASAFELPFELPELPFVGKLSIEKCDLSKCQGTLDDCCEADGQGACSDDYTRVQTEVECGQGLLEYACCDPAAIGRQSMVELGVYVLLLVSFCGYVCAFCCFCSGACLTCAAPEDITCAGRSAAAERPPPPEEARRSREVLPRSESCPTGRRRTRGRPRPSPGGGRGMSSARSRGLLVCPRLLLLSGTKGADLPGQCFRHQSAARPMGKGGGGASLPKQVPDHSCTHNGDPG
ncbi:unnamed protein product [Prorocentrum cordatum]|uniref:Uncharacterized protein n=1 Tax=Prorocentrum cordatum TaxID=2364126 RepID=A0ABN9U627_9DINO|nr:unnamed protein product [Polarella glacialis]